MSNQTMSNNIVLICNEALDALETVALRPAGMSVIFTFINDDGRSMDVSFEINTLGEWMVITDLFDDEGNNVGTNECMYDDVTDALNNLCWVNGDGEPEPSTMGMVKPFYEYMDLDVGISTRWAGVMGLQCAQEVCRVLQVIV